MFESNIRPVALKTQVIREIVRYIHTVDLGEDNKLPREEVFCQILGISRVTLRAALDELEANGIVLRKHGKGTFVNPHSLDMKVSFNPAMDFFETILLSGYQPSAKVLSSERIPVPPEFAADLGLTSGQEVLCIKKIVYADGRFCAYLEDIINLSLIENPDELVQCACDVPIFSILDQKFNLRVEWDKVEIGAVTSRSIPELAPLVERGECKDGALLHLCGINYDESSRPVMRGQEVIDTDLIRFHQMRKRQWHRW